MTSVDGFHNYKLSWYLIPLSLDVVICPEDKVSHSDHCPMNLSVHRVEEQWVQDKYSHILTIACRVRPDNWSFHQ